jgi:uncharacterized protein (TIGR02145 family)
MIEIKIGKQIWLSENLSLDTFANGDPIPEAETAEQWEEANRTHSPCYCENERDYGKLYNWYAVIDPRGLAPKGWKIPTAEDWIELIRTCGKSERSGNKLKCPNSWHFERATKSNGFNALPGGCCNDAMNFYDQQHWGCWWSSTNADDLCAVAVNMSNEFDGMGVVDDDKGYGLSVRCLKET